ncbi:MAG: glucose-1-phosphate cytidylyltransferase [Micropepsaceae bacterium]
MKVVILAGGLGTRISEETHLRPKPMIEIGGRPILWHIMKFYAAHGCTDFIVCVGYRGYMIKEYFANYRLHRSDVTVDLARGDVVYHASSAEPWKVTIVDTGEDTMTGGRVRRIREYLTADEPFCLTYGDGVTDLDIRAEVAFHRAHGKDATVAAIVPPGRYGALELKGQAVTNFIEKPPGDNALINGGFFVLHPRVIDRIAADETSWEAEPLQGLAQDGQLMAFRHAGFWQAMDTLRDKNRLESLWDSGQAPWKVWDK